MSGNLAQTCDGARSQNQALAKVQLPLADRSTNTIILIGITILTLFNMLDLALWSIGA